uniref:Uncharacterized protein n=1 Tax=Nelumbo nucifera TaxID=4432 RepID=A0A822YP61_NELNU|nr:TPA_asm: hypothetical protein HUJ06_012744 [Nelumbo nucifera]
MGTPSFLWNFMKSITGGLIALTISDRYASIVSVHGLSMHHTFNSSTNSVLRSLSEDCTSMIWVQMTMFWWRSFVLQIISLQVEM